MIQTVFKHADGKVIQEGPMPLITVLDSLRPGWPVLLGEDTFIVIAKKVSMNWDKSHAEITVKPKEDARETCKD